MIFIYKFQNLICSLESFDVFCFGQILYEMSVGKPLYAYSSLTTNNVINVSYNTSTIEGTDDLPHQMTDSTSKPKIESIINT